MSSSLDAYDDLMGLELGSDLDGILDAEVLKTLAVAGAAGGAAMLGVSYLWQKVSQLQALSTLAPTTRTYALAGGAVALGVGLGALAANRGYGAPGYAVAGAVAGLGLVAIAKQVLNVPTASLAEIVGDEQQLNDYDYDTINGLAETAIETMPQLPSGGSLHGAVVSSEGTMSGYEPFLV